jgi:hypothetical protein
MIKNVNKNKNVFNTPRKYYLISTYNDVFGWCGSVGKEV